MTTTATPRPDTFFTGLDQARSVKRLGLGPKFYDTGVSIPELVEQPDGPYVTHADYLKLLRLAEQKANGVGADPAPVPDSVFLGCARMGMADASDEEVLNYVRLAISRAAPQLDAA